MSIGLIVNNMGFVGLAVMCCLLGLSLYSISVIVDRHRRFRAATRESMAFLPEFGECLSAGKLKESVKMANRYEKSHVARVVSAGVSEFMENHQAQVEPRLQVEMVSRMLDRTMAKTLAEMKKGLGGLATIGSMAPFIGLFGTIVGIIHAFEGIASSGSGGIAAVSGGIAEALVATALGILVAIPAVMGFNHFTVSLERFQLEMATTSAELVDFFSKFGAANASQ